jgi:hypothetical protein
MNTEKAVAMQRLLLMEIISCNGRGGVTYFSFPVERHRGCVFLVTKQERRPKKFAWGKTPSVFPQVPYLRSERVARYETALIARSG